MKIVLCDDNKVILNQNKCIVVDALKKLGQDMEVLAFSKTAEVLEYAKKSYIDIAILDIEIDENSGIDVAKRLNYLQPSCCVIFLTNFLEYATEVYETTHNNYVLKGQFAERAESIIEKAIKSQEDSQKKVFISDGKTTFVVPEKEIVYIERNQRYTIIHTDKGEEYKTKERVDEVERLLDKEKFTRCHNSYIVSMMHIKQYSRTMIVLDDGLEINVSRQYIGSVRDQFLEWSDKQK